MRQALRAGGRYSRLIRIYYLSAAALAADLYKYGY